METGKLKGHVAILLANIIYGLNIPVTKGYFLVPFGMKYLRATTVSVYMNLQPVVASLVAIIVGQDVFSWDKPLAALLVLTGAYIVSTSPAKNRQEKKE